MSVNFWEVDDVWIYGDSGMRLLAFVFSRVVHSWNLEYGRDAADSMWRN